MDHLSLIVVAIGLSLDSFASALSCGSRTSEGVMRMAIRVAVVFAVIQTALAVLGWLAGSFIASWLFRFDHWIAFILLLVVGSRMIHESLKARKEGKVCSAPRFSEIVLLGIGTSIDSFIVGGSYAFLGISILMPAVYILAFTTGISLAGGLLGGRLNQRMGGIAEVGGGLMIIAIGARILVSHLFF